jgi:hypothetical protein
MCAKTEGSKSTESVLIVGECRVVLLRTHLARSSYVSVIPGEAGLGKRRLAEKGSCDYAEIQPRLVPASHAADPCWQVSIATVPHF